MLTIGECDLFLYNGGESDAWVERVLATAANPDRRTLSVMEVLGDSVLEEEVVEGMQEAEDHDHAEGEAHEEEADEHVWLSLRNARTACAEIARVLGELDPDHAAEYQANAENYMAELEALDGGIYRSGGECGPQDGAGRGSFPVPVPDGRLWPGVLCGFFGLFGGDRSQL